MNFGDADSIIAMYRVKFPEELDDWGCRLAARYASRYTQLKALVPVLRQSLQPEQFAALDVKIPGGATSDARIRTMVPFSSRSEHVKFSRLIEEI